jgi:general secretion pathway protein N
MILRRRRGGRPWANTAAATGWGESTFAELSWDKSRRAVTRWSVGGVLLGSLLALIAFAPASWLAQAIGSASNQHVLLADARGTVWSGSAVAVLTGGPGSRDASALPGRLEWTLGLKGFGLELRARHACCLNGAASLLLRPGLGRVSIALAPATGWIGQWPTAWLGGLGTPWNTMQMGGAVRLNSPGGIVFESVQGRWGVKGRADVDLIDVSSRLSTLETLGSYRLTLSGAASGSGPAELQLSTQQGALQLSGNGTLGPAGVRFRGEARAGSGDEAALANLLNIIGRRDGVRSVISIG